MKKKASARSAQPLSTAERLGRVWGGVFVFIVLILTVVLVGKALFFKPE